MKLIDALQSRQVYKKVQLKISTLRNHRFLGLQPRQTVKNKESVQIKLHLCLAERQNKTVKELPKGSADTVVVVHLSTI